MSKNLIENILKRFPDAANIESVDVSEILSDIKKRENNSFFSFLVSLAIMSGLETVEGMIDFSSKHQISIDQIVSDEISFMSVPIPPVKEFYHAVVMVKLLREIKKGEKNEKTHL